MLVSLTLDESYFTARTERVGLNVGLGYRSEPNIKGNTYNSADTLGVTRRETVTSKMGNLGSLTILLYKQLVRSHINFAFSQFLTCIPKSQS